MSLFKVFKTRIFWIVWLIVCIIGAIAGIMYGRNQEEKLTNARTCRLKLYGDKEMVYILNNYGQKDQYLEFLNQEKTPEKWRVDLGFGKPGSQILVTDTLFGGKLIEFITVQKRFPASGKDKSKVKVYSWVFKEFVSCSE